MAASRKKSNAKKPKKIGEEVARNQEDATRNQDESVQNPAVVVQSTEQLQDQDNKNDKGVNMADDKSTVTEVSSIASKVDELCSQFPGLCSDVKKLRESVDDLYTIVGKGKPGSEKVPNIMSSRGVSRADVRTPVLDRIDGVRRIGDSADDDDDDRIRPGFLRRRISRAIGVRDLPLFSRLRRDKGHGVSVDEFLNCSECRSKILNRIKNDKRISDELSRLMAGGVEDGKHQGHDDGGLEGIAGKGNTPKGSSSREQSKAGSRATQEEVGREKEGAGRASEKEEQEKGSGIFRILRRQR